MAQKLQEAPEKEKLNDGFEQKNKVYETYETIFFEERKRLYGKNHKNIPSLRKAWLRVAYEKITDEMIDQFLSQINKKTSKKGVFILSMEIGEIIGTDPLMFAPSLEALYKMKSYLTRLLNKVRQRESN